MNVTNKTTAQLLLAVSSLLVWSGCNPQLGEVAHRKRTYTAPVQFAQEAERPGEGGIWSPSMQGNYLFTDKRARRVGDLVTVVVREQADARRGATMETKRESATSNAINEFLGLIKNLQPQLAPLDLINAKTNADFSGAGTTTRTESLQATVPATVIKVLPNGNLFIEGNRTILVNTEENRFYISGVVRPEDIGDDNVIPSSRVAEAEIAFNGRGNITDTINEPLLQRGLKKYSPF